MGAKFEIIVFLGTHDSLLLVGMVIITYKMKKAMNDYAGEFLVERSRTVSYGILADGIDAYENIPRKSLALAIVKGNDIGKIIMIEKAPVYIQYIIVGTKNYIDSTKMPHFALRNSFEPQIVKGTRLELEIGILKEISYHIIKFVQI